MVSSKYVLLEKAFLSWKLPIYGILWCVNIFLLFNCQVCVWLFATPWTVACHASLSLHHLSEFAQVHIHWIGDAIQPSHPLSPFFLLPLIFPSIRVFSNEPAIGQTIGASASVLSVSINDWFPLRLTGLSSLLSKGL